MQNANIVTLLFTIISLHMCHLSTAQQSTRHKRDLVDFCRQIECSTHRVCSAYHLHGCFCGASWFDGLYDSELTPVDAIDECCKWHDECYDVIKASGCDPYSSAYSYTCASDNVTCDTEGNSRCELAGCECDRNATECYTRYGTPTGQKCPQHSEFRKVVRGTLHTATKIVQKGSFIVVDGVKHWAKKIWSVFD